MKKNTAERWRPVGRGSGRGKFGELLRGVLREDGGRPNKNASDDRKGFLVVMGKAGLKQDAAYRYQVMSHCPVGKCSSTKIEAPTNSVRT